jgi:urease accessory protein
LSAVATPPPLHGGWRLQPAHFEPDRVPPEVARYGGASTGLAVGSPGKVGILELGFERRGGAATQRTELVHHFQKVPLQIMRPLYFDESRPDIPYTYVMTTGGGVLHGDRQRIDLHFGVDTTAHVTTQAHSKLYRMEGGYATSLLNIDAAAGAYVEYLPDPVIPYAHSRFYQRTRVTLDPTATLVLGETLYAGRLSRGERHEYDVFAADLEITRPDGRPVLIDRARLVPEGGRVDSLAVLNDCDIVSTLFVLTPLVGATELADLLHVALGDAIVDDTLFGVSVLPDAVGAWVRIAGDDTVTMAELNRIVRSGTRAWLTGRPAPHIRK